MSYLLAAVYVVCLVCGSPSLMFTVKCVWSSVVCRATYCVLGFVGAVYTLSGCYIPGRRWVVCVICASRVMLI